MLREKRACRPSSRSKLPDSIEIEDDLEKACTGQDIIVFSVASPFVRSTAELAKPFIRDGQIIVNVGKGIEDKTLMTLCEVLSDVLRWQISPYFPDRVMRKRFPKAYLLQL